MKILPKLQRGGSFDSFFAIYEPIQYQEQREQARQTQPTQSSEKGKLTEKDLFDMIKDINGLPSDMQGIVSNLMTTFQFANLTGTDPENLANLYLQNLYQIRVAGQNMKEYESAIENAGNNGALAEPAISLDGRIMIQKDDGSIGAIDVETYNNNRDQYKVLTVSNLAHMRKYDPWLANNQDIVDIINNGVGYELFQKLLDSAVSSLGSTEYTRNGLISTDKAQQGLTLLQSLSQDDRIQALGSITAKGLYEYKIIDKNQLSQINTLTNYLATVLPDRIKTWITLKSGDSNKTKATKDIIFQYLISGNDISHTFDINYKGNPESSESSSSSKDEKGIESINQNIAVKWLSGLGVQNLFTVNSGTPYSIRVLANTMPLTDRSNNYLGSNSTLQQATQGEYSSILDFSNVSMGGNRIDRTNLDKVILLDGKISSIDFPSYVKDGVVMPILSKEVIAAKEAADKEIENLGINLNNPKSIVQNYQKINDIYERYGLSSAYNEKGELVNGWTRFGVIDAEASNDTLGMDKGDSTNLLQEIDDDTLIQNLLNITKEERDNFIIGGINHYYRGTVWIPVQESYVAAMANTSLNANELKEILKGEASLNSAVTKEHI